VIEGNPHLLDRIDSMLVESLNGYMELPAGDPSVRAPALGANAGPLGAIALAMSAKR
jgi:fructokinase